MSLVKTEQIKNHEIVGAKKLVIRQKIATLRVLQGSSLSCM